MFGVLGVYNFVFDIIWFYGMFPLGWHNCEGVVAKYHGEILMEGENESATEVDT